MDPALRRWLISRLDRESEEYADGYLDGREWASMCFGDHERLNLQKFRTASSRATWEAVFRDEPGTPSSALERLFFVMNPERLGDAEAFEEFRYDLLDWALDFKVGETGEWARGFAEASVEHWETDEFRHSKRAVPRSVVGSAHAGDLSKLLDRYKFVPAAVAPDVQQVDPADDPADTDRTSPVESKSMRGLRERFEGFILEINQASN